MNRAAAALALLRHRRLATVAGGLLMVTVALALALPVRVGGSAGPESPATASALAGAATSEDLDAFLDSRRWGVSLREKQATNAAAAARSAEDEAGADKSAVRFVGFIAAEDGQSGFLVLPNGDLLRLTLGTSLADGRVVAAISDRAVTLRSASGDEEVLALFPSQHRASSGAAGSGAASSASRALDAADDATQDR